jgi:hypothetical protein
MVAIMVLEVVFVLRDKVAQLAGQLLLLGNVKPSVCPLLLLGSADVLALLALVLLGLARAAWRIRLIVAVAFTIPIFC